MVWEVHHQMTRDWNPSTSLFLEKDFLIQVQRILHGVHGYWHGHRSVLHEGSLEEVEFVHHFLGNSGQLPFLWGIVYLQFLHQPDDPVDGGGSSDYWYLVPEGAQVLDNQGNFVFVITQYTWYLYSYHHVTHGFCYISPCSKYQNPALDELLPLTDRPHQ